MRRHGPWVIHDQTLKYASDFLDLHEDRVERPDGTPGTYATVTLKAGVAVLPVDTDGLVHLTRRGGMQLVQTEIDTIAEAHVMLAEFERLWRGRLDRIGDVLAAPGGDDQP